MPHCPKCNFLLCSPPDDIQDWFRCENCHTPLRLPSELGRILFFVSTFGVLVVFWTIESFGIRHNWRIFKLIPEGFDFLLYGFPLVIYGALIRLVWNTKLTALKVYDPYSALNLSDDKTKLRGR